MEEHFYKVDRYNLSKLGFRPTRSIAEELEIMLKDLIRYKARLQAKRHVITPRVRWRGDLSAPLPTESHRTRLTPEQRIISVVRQRLGG